MSIKPNIKLLWHRLVLLRIQFCLIPVKSLHFIASAKTHSPLWDCKTVSAGESRCTYVLAVNDSKEQKLAGSGRWDWFMGARHGGAWHWLNQGDGIDLCAMGACDTGWIRALGLIYGWALCGHATLAGSGRWDWFMTACHGAHNTGWIGAMRLIYGGAWLCLEQRDGIGLQEHAAPAGSGRWNLFMGACHWGTWHWLDWVNDKALYGCWN